MKILIKSSNTLIETSHIEMEISLEFKISGNQLAGNELTVLEKLMYKDELSIDDKKILKNLDFKNLEINPKRETIIIEGEKYNNNDIVTDESIIKIRRRRNKIRSIIESNI